MVNPFAMTRVRRSHIQCLWMRFCLLRTDQKFAPVMYWHVSHVKVQKPKTLQVVCQELPNCSRHVVQKITQSSRKSMVMCALAATTRTSAASRSNHQMRHVNQSNTWCQKANTSQSARAISSKKANTSWMVTLHLMTSLRLWVLRPWQIT